MLDLKNAITTVDSHAEGEAIRTIISGLAIPGRTVVEKKAFFQKNLDHVRKTLTLEPRGRKSLIYAVLLPGTRNRADLGVFFMYSEGYADLCLSGAMAAVATAVETGKLRPGKSKVILETPAGLIDTCFTSRNGSVDSVMIRNVPAFHYQSLSVRLPRLGKVPVHVMYASDFIALVEARDLDLSLETKKLQAIVEKAMLLKESLNAAAEFRYPGKNRPDGISGVRVYELEGHASSTSVTIFGEGNIDRSPCGNGTCAHMAYLHLKGRLGLNQRSIHRSIFGGRFVGRLVKVVKVGRYDAVVPEVAGRVRMVAVCKNVIAENDPFKHGFIVP